MAESGGILFRLFGCSLAYCDTVSAKRGLRLTSSNYRGISGSYSQKTIQVRCVETRSSHFTVVLPSQRVEEDEKVR